MAYLYLVVALIVSVVLHLSAMAIALHWCGVRLKRISFGLGPVILNVGIVTFSPLLLGGSVTMLDSREGPVSESELGQAFNYKPVWIQVLVPLSGVLALGILGYGLVGSAMLPALFNGWYQFVNVFSPGSSQMRLHEVRVFAETHSFSTVLGFTATKLAAINLLPLPPLNGAQALINLIKMGQPEVSWEARLLEWAIWPGLGLFVFWCLSIFVYFYRLLMR